MGANSPGERPRAEAVERQLRAPAAGPGPRPQHHHRLRVRRVRLADPGERPGAARQRGPLSGGARLRLAVRAASLVGGGGVCFRGEGVGGQPPPQRADGDFGGVRGRPCWWWEEGRGGHGSGGGGAAAGAAGARGRAAGTGAAPARAAAAARGRGRAGGGASGPARWEEIPAFKNEEDFAPLRGCFSLKRTQAKRAR